MLLHLHQQMTDDVSCAGGNESDRHPSGADAPESLMEALYQLLRHGLYQGCDGALDGVDAPFMASPDDARW